MKIGHDDQTVAALPRPAGQPDRLTRLDVAPLSRRRSGQTTGVLMGNYIDTVSDALERLDDLG